MTFSSKTIEEFGGEGDAFVYCDRERPENLHYATLISARSRASTKLASIIGVYEWQDRPLMLLIDGSNVDTKSAFLREIRRTIAMRGDTPYLGVLSTGRLSVYSVGLDSASEKDALIEIPEKIKY